MLDIDSALVGMGDTTDLGDEGDKQLMQDGDGIEMVKVTNGETPAKHGDDTAASADDRRKKSAVRDHTVKLYQSGSRRCCCVLILVITMMAIISGVVILLVFLLQEKYIHVVLPVGTVRGKLVTSPQGQEVEEYLGIPFALPPIGDLRYADPQPLAKLPTAVYEAFDMKYSCIQYVDTTFGTFPGSHMWNALNELREDCLYLNVWVPTVKTDSRKAVMVWIYGGGFYYGSNSLWVYDGKALASFGDVIVVSFNYRVGTFGFLSTGDGRIKGNFGMKDQVMALQWVKDNIYSFGGDPELVTVFGESSGASSAGLHLMSDLSHHLFHRAIFESGSPDAHWGFMTSSQAKTRSGAFLNSVNCTQVDTNELMICLRNLDVTAIRNNEWVTSNFMEFPWAPSVDGEFMIDTPFNLLRKGRFDKKDVLLGVNKDEGTFWILYSLPGFSKDGPSYQNYSTFKNGVDILDWDLSRSDRETLMSLYTTEQIRNISSRTANRDALDKVCGDRSFTCPTKALADLYAEKGHNTYFYYLTYRASNEVWPPWMGVIHGAEIQWIFGMPLNDSRHYTEEEKSFSRAVMQYWTNFAKHGNPNSQGLHTWPKYTKESPQYLNLGGASHLSVNDTLRDNFCAFWSDINQKINSQHAMSKRRVLIRPYIT